MSLSIIVPCYNELSRLPQVPFLELIDQFKDVRICFVNDGSTDGTALLLDRISSRSPRINALHLPKNQGKAEAVRQGIMFMMKEYDDELVCYLDADLSTPIAEVMRLGTVMTADAGLLFAFGSRVSVFGSKIQRYNYRHYGGRLVATLIDMVLKLSIYDTQCGLKMFRRSIALELFGRPFLTKWLFDVELFARMRQIFDIGQLMAVMKEVPVAEWQEKGNSKIRMFDMAWVPVGLLQIRANYPGINRITRPGTPVILPQVRYIETVAPITNDVTLDLKH